jgi:hypothetical protein
MCSDVLHHRHQDFADHQDMHSLLAGHFEDQPLG